MSLTKVSYSMVNKSSISVVDFGADPTGTNDSTVAIQAAFDFMTANSNSVQDDLGQYLGNAPKVYFPEGVYLISDELSWAASYCRIDGNQAILKPTASFSGNAAIYVPTSAWRSAITGLQFENFAVGINAGTPNTGSTIPQIRDCSFFNCDIGIYLDDRSAIAVIQRCIFRKNRCDIHSESIDWTVIKDCYQLAGTLANDGDAHIVANNSSKIILENWFGNPQAQTISEPAWVKISGKGSALYTYGHCRFGGEVGGYTVVNANAAASLSTTDTPSIISIQDGMTYSGPYAGDRSIVRLFDLPNAILIKNNYGMVNSPYVTWSSTVSSGTQATLVAQVTDSRLRTNLFRFAFRDNIHLSPSTTNPPIPSNIIFPEYPENSKLRLEGSSGSHAYTEFFIEETAISADTTLGETRYYSGDTSVGPGIVAYQKGIQATTACEGKIIWGTGRPSGSSGTETRDRLILDPLGNLLASEDNLRTLGGASNRWSEVFAGNGTINTSDANEKQDVRDLTTAESNVAATLKTKLKAFKFIDAVESKGDEARIHFGVIAQDVKSAFEAEGLDATKYGLFCSNTWMEKDGEVVMPDEENQYPEGSIEKTRLGIRYEQLLAFIISAL